MKELLISVFFLEFAIELVLKGLGYNGDNSPETRKEILKYFTEANIQAGIEYARSGFSVGLVLFIVKKLFFVWFVFSKFPKKLENYFSALSGHKNYLTIIFYFTFLDLALTLLLLPFSWYFGFYLEHQFGFSNMSFGFWIWTELKTFLVSWVFFIPTVLIALFIIQKIRFLWVFVVPIAGVVLGLITSVLYPILILPLFYTTEPIAEGSLKNKILELSKKANINSSEIYIIKESEYSKHTNAFFVGFGDNKKIYLFDTLIQTNTESEILSVLGHEIGHWKFNHQLIGIGIEFLSSVFLFLFLYFILSRFRNSGEIDEYHSLSTVPLMIFVYGILSFFLNPIDSTISRKMEADADYEALVLTNDKKSFISSEIKLAKENKDRLNPNGIVVFWKYSHPKTMDRIKMAEKYKVKK
ncbi:MAG: M48 family metallopeptidase [Leptospiraceae bacterium]|nr:M48 family metallopeptidase [Leptospiraceae bacterium]